MKTGSRKKEYSNDFINKETGEVMDGKLNEVIVIRTERPNGSIREQWDYRYCPTMAEQHTAHLTDINYLMEKYKPDELAAYLAARTMQRQEILGHDFSTEPSLQEAKNMIYRSKQAFSELPEHVQMQFKNHLEFVKFIDNPANAEKLIELGLATKRQLDAVKIEKDASPQATPQTTTQEEAKKEQ